MNDRNNPMHRLQEELAQRCTNRPDGTSVLRCEDAFELARAADVSVADVGALCNEQGIKIAHCQLGCFR